MVKNLVLSPQGGYCVSEVSLCEVATTLANEKLVEGEGTQGGYRLNDFMASLMQLYVKFFQMYP